MPKSKAVQRIKAASKGGEDALLSTKDLKEFFRQNNPEAMDNIMEYMRDAKVLSKDYSKELDSLRDKMCETENPGEILEIASEIKSLLSQKEKCDEKVLKASIKVLDVTYNLIVHDDNILIKKAANRIKNRESNSTDDTEAPSEAASAISLTVV